MRQALFLVFLGLGIACLVVGLFLTRHTWRSDIEPYGRRSRFFQIALHPERFARPGLLPTIRSLNFAGAAFIVLALGVVGYDIASIPPGQFRH